MVKPPDNSSLYKSAESYQRVMAHYDACFRRMGVAYETRYVDTRFGLTHVIVSGSKNDKPVVLWHGGNANSTAWAEWIPALASVYRVYAVDTIGEMGKSAPSRPSRTGPAYGQWATSHTAPARIPWRAGRPTSPCPARGASSFGGIGPAAGPGATR